MDVEILPGAATVTLPSPMGPPATHRALARAPSVAARPGAGAEVCSKAPPTGSTPSPRRSEPGLLLTYARDPARAEQAARAALAKDGDTRFASAALAEIHMRRGEAEPGGSPYCKPRARSCPGSGGTRSRSPTCSRRRTGTAGRGAPRGGACRRRTAPPRSQAPVTARAGARRPQPRAWLLHGAGGARAGLPRLCVRLRDAGKRSRWRTATGTPRVTRGAPAPGCTRGTPSSGDSWPSTSTRRRPRRRRTSRPFGRRSWGVRRIPVRTRMITGAHRCARRGRRRATADVRRDDDVRGAGRERGGRRAGPAGSARADRAGTARPPAVAVRRPDRAAAQPEGMQGAIMEAGRPRVVAGAIAAIVTKPVSAAGAGSTGWRASRRR